MRNSHLYLFLIMLFITGSCDNYPRDTNDSFKQAKEKKLKVGVVENPPQVVFKNDSIRGTEIRLIEKFAEKHNMNIQYTMGTETQLVKQLENYDLHIVAGGFNYKTVWRSKVSLTVSYDQKHVLLIPKGENGLLHELEQHIFETS